MLHLSKPLCLDLNVVYRQLFCFMPLLTLKYGINLVQIILDSPMSKYYNIINDITDLQLK